jgi:integrase
MAKCGAAAAKRLGIGWVNCLVLRRSFATWLKMAGADIKDAQPPRLLKYLQQIVVA